jgi:methylmalonyl-CoA mutase cobalamin-binding domain/chain
MEQINWESLQEDFLNILLNSEIERALSITRETLAKGGSPADFFERCITPALEEIGNRFERLDIFLPEMVEAAELVELINKQVIQPGITTTQHGNVGTEQTTPKGKVLLATVQGDLHDIGKSMVALMLKVNGFEVHDIGIDVSPTEIVDRAQQEEVDIIGLSSLLTTCLPYMKDVIDFLQGMGSRKKFAVVVGGAAVTPQFAEEIGADAYGRSSAEAAKICNKLMNSRVSSG